MNFVKTLLAAAAVAASCGANAVVTGALTGGAGSVASLNCNGPCGVAGTGGSLSGSITGTFTGGAVYAADMSFADDVAPGENFYAVGPTPGGFGTPNTGTLSLGAGLSFISFLWGSPDTFNSLTVNSTGPGPNSQTFTATGTGFPAAFPVSNGDQSFFQLVSFTAGAGSLITSLVFTSTSNAFEVGRFSTTPVPEPETYALLLAGLGALGFVSRRRRRA
jgi:hypothetical protein